MENRDSWDYPAAHSMDTMWFALDEEGHVALFDSGEAGAVPHDAYEGEDWGPTLDALVQAGPRGEPVHHLPGHRPVAQPTAVRHVTPHDRVPLHVLLFLRSLDGVKDLLAAGTGRRVTASEGHGVVFAAMDRAVFERLHREDACLGCVHHWTVSAEPAAEAEEEPTGRAARRGLYVFTHATDNWISGPYGCVQRPSQPLTEGAVPAAVRQRLVRFPGKFSQADFIQPVEVWECEAWGGAWLASDEKTIRPFPGKPTEYAEEYANVRDPSGADGLVWTPTTEVPPPPPQPAAARKPWWKFW